MSSRKVPITHLLTALGVSNVIPQLSDIFSRVQEVRVPLPGESSTVAFVSHRNWINLGKAMQWGAAGISDAQLQSTFLQVCQDAGLEAMDEEAFFDAIFRVAVGVYPQMAPGDALSRFLTANMTAHSNRLRPMDLQECLQRYSGAIDVMYAAFTQDRPTPLYTADALSCEAWLRLCKSFGLCPKPLSPNSAVWAFNRGAPRNDCISRHGLEAALLAVSRFAFSKNVNGEGISASHSFMAMIVYMNASGHFKTLGAQRSVSTHSHPSLLLLDDDDVRAMLYIPPSQIERPATPPALAPSSGGKSNAAPTGSDVITKESHPNTVALYERSAQSGCLLSSARFLKLSRDSNWSSLGAAPNAGEAAWRAAVGMRSHVTLDEFEAALNHVALVTHEGDVEALARHTFVAVFGASSRSLSSSTKTTGSAASKPRSPTGTNSLSSSTNTQGSRLAGSKDAKAALAAFDAKTTAGADPVQVGAALVTSRATDKVGMAMLLDSSNAVMREMQQQIQNLREEKAKSDAELAMLMSTLRVATVQKNRLSERVEIIGHEVRALDRRSVSAGAGATRASSTGRVSTPPAAKASTPTTASGGRRSVSPMTSTPASRAANISGTLDASTVTVHNTSANSNRLNKESGTIPPMKFSLSARKVVGGGTNAYRAPTPTRRPEGWVPPYKSFKQVKAHVGLGTMSASNCYLTSLQGMGLYRDLHVLYLQGNYLSDLCGFRSQPHLKELHLGNNRIVSLRGFPPIPTLEKLILRGNPIDTHELYRPMCLLAVGHSLLRLDEEGIQLDTREAAYLLGPRAAEAIFEGWLPDSIKRSEKEWDALISVYRSKNAKSDEELAAARAADAAKPKRPRSVSPGSARTARPTTPIVPAAAAQARPVSPSLHATRNRGAPAPSAAATTGSQEEIQRLRRDLQLERDRYAALANKTSSDKAKAAGSDDSAAAEVLQLRSELARAEARLTRAFTAEELVRLPHVAFGKLGGSSGGKKVELELILDEAGLQFVSMDGRSQVLLNASADNPVQVSASTEGFTVDCSEGHVSVEHKHCGTIARLVKLWMAYKREKRRITRQRSGGHSQQGDSICPPVELAASARPL